MPGSTFRQPLARRRSNDWCAKPVNASARFCTGKERSTPQPGGKTVTRHCGSHNMKRGLKEDVYEATKASDSPVLAAVDVEAARRPAEPLWKSDLG